MHQGLRDFSIENESNIVLSFVDGTRQRVREQELARYLADADLTRVKEALRIRRQFMKKVLPPTAMLMLVVGVLALGSYDAHLVATRLQQAATSTASTKASPVTPPAWIQKLLPQPIKASTSSKPSAITQPAAEPSAVAVSPASAPASASPVATPSTSSASPSPAVNRPVPTQVLESTVIPQTPVVHPIQPAQLVKDASGQLKEKLPQLHD